jgi:hypothetical protein
VLDLDELLRWRAGIEFDGPIYAGVTLALRRCNP